MLVDAEVPAGGEQADGNRSDLRVRFIDPELENEDVGRVKKCLTEVVSQEELVGDEHSEAHEHQADQIASELLSSSLIAYSLQASNKERQDENDLHLASNDPTPEEAAFIRDHEVRNLVDRHREH